MHGETGGAEDWSAWTASEKHIDAAPPNERLLRSDLNRLLRRLRKAYDDRLPAKAAEQIRDAYQKIGETNPGKAAAFFADEGDAGHFTLSNPWKFWGLAGEYAEARKDAELGPYVRDIAEQFSGRTLRLSIEKMHDVGLEVARAYFLSRKSEWDEGKENRWLVLEQFFLDAIRLDVLAEETLLRSASSGTKTSDGLVAVTVDVPALQYDQRWYEYHPPAYVEDEEDADDNDYKLPSELKKYDNLEHARTRDFTLLLRGIRTDNRQTMAEAIERAVGYGPVPPEKMKGIIDQVLFVAKAWEYKDSNPETPLPDSAGPLAIRNARLERERTIEPFVSILRKRMLEAALSGAVDRVRNGKANPEKLLQEMNALEKEAVDLYRDVVKTGVPVFREFATWLLAEQEKAGHAGEFYVGRDTMGTLYPAAHAARWGNMTGERRHKLTVFVNVSRPLAGATTREVMRKWLEQEGVTEHMLGIDGGYSGSSPEKVFQALNPNLTTTDLDAKVRLLEVHSIESRRMNKTRSYNGIVKWMESLPKFTDRAKKVEKSPFGKYYVMNGKRRSPAERVLAWTVQHAVWRELINHDPIAHALRTEDDSKEIPEYDEKITEHKEKKPGKFGEWWGPDYDEDPATSSKKSEGLTEKQFAMQNWLSENGFPSYIGLSHKPNAEGKLVVDDGIFLDVGDDSAMRLPDWLVLNGTVNVWEGQTQLIKSLREQGVTVEAVKASAIWGGTSNYGKPVPFSPNYEVTKAPDTEVQYDVRSSLYEWADVFGETSDWIDSHFAVYPDGRVRMLKPMRLDWENVESIPDLSHVPASTRIIYVGKEQTKLAADAAKKGYAVIEINDESEDIENGSYDSAYNGVW